MALLSRTEPAPALIRPTVLSELRALWAVTTREWRIFRRYPSFFLAVFVWPVIFPAVYLLTGRALSGPDGSGLQVFTRATGSSDFFGYIVIGTTFWMWQNVVLWDVGNILRREQRQGTLETNWVTPTWRFSLLLGTSLVQLFTMSIFLLISGLEYNLIFGVQFHGSLWLVALVLLAAIPSIYGIGMTFASLVFYAKESNIFVFLTRGLVMIFCGITYPTSILPAWMQVVAGLLPPTYAIRSMRAVILNGAGLNALLPDLTMLALFGAFWLTAGFLAFHYMERRTRRTSGLNEF